MKRLLSILTIFVFTLITSNVFGQCSPDTSLKTTATRPDFLDTAKVGVLYSQVIQFHITKDTVVYVPQLGQTLNTRIDTLWITGVTGLPDGFTFSCNNADCKITGGTTGCVTLTGTPKPNTGGIYPLLVLIKIRATAMLGRIPVGQTVNDTNARYFIMVDGPAGITKITSGNDVQVYPNPASKTLNIAVPASEDVFTYELRDQAGRIVLNGRNEEHQSVSNLDVSSVPFGYYLLTLTNGDRMYTKPVILLDR